jgi:hypothetical protein
MAGVDATARRAVKRRACMGGAMKIVHKLALAAVTTVGLASLQLALQRRHK